MIECRFENENVALLRHVTADVIVLDDVERVLLCKRATHLVEGGKHALPGGYVDRDEFLHDAARREVLEETGYEVDDLVLLMVTSDPRRAGDDRQNVTFVFFGTAGAQVGQPDDESTEMNWFSFDELPARSEIAFDHLESIEMFRSHLTGEVSLPVVR